MVVVWVALAAALVVLVVVVVRRRRTPDTVASFRRQIDALSAEARRPVVDQVKRTEGDEAARRGGDAGVVPVSDTGTSREDTPGDAPGGDDAGSGDGGSSGDGADGGAASGADGGGGGDGGGD